jgi:hypothetical protein
MSRIQPTKGSPHVFGLEDWVDWLETNSRRIFGLTATEFEAAYAKGELNSGCASDLASVLPLLRSLREKAN